ncbi:protein Peter pan-like [Glossina fuscipes fuscipes]
MHQFTLARDVISLSKKQYVDEEIFKYSPLVIMNNFTGEGKHLKLMTHTFQDMFPAINITQTDIATIRRCLLFSYNPQNNLIDVRHYSIQVVPVGLTRGVKKLIMGQIPNLAKCEDIADFIMQDNASESEAEADENSQVILPQTLKTLKRKGNLEENKSAVQLYEIGPLTGEVLYHDHIIKTEEEKEILRKMIEKKRKLKEQRKKEQAENRARNLKEQEKQQKSKQKQRSTENEAVSESGDEDASDADDDAEYFKQEVGEKPDEELFKSSVSNPRKRHVLPPHNLKQSKKTKIDRKFKKNCS